MFSSVCRHNIFIFLRYIPRKIAIVVGIRWYFIVASICISQMTNDINNNNNLAICLSSFTMPIQIFYQVLNWVICFLINEQVNFLLYSRYKNFIIFTFANIFTSLWLVLIYLMVSFEIQNF